MVKIHINTEYITLSQFLKLANLVGSGGEAKFFLLDNKVLINNIEDNRRGKKLYKNDNLEVLGVKYTIC